MADEGTGTPDLGQGGSGTPGSGAGGTPGSGAPADSGSAGTPAGDSSGVVPDWRATLPEDIRNDPVLQPYKDVESLAKSHIHAERRFGNAVAIPGKDASAAEREAFFTKLGRPENPAGYEFDSVKPQNFEFNQDFLGGYRETAHKLGISKSQAAGLLEWYANTVDKDIGSFVGEIDGEHDETVESLKNEYGAAWDDKYAQAQQAVEQFGGQELRDWFEETGIGNNVPLIRAFVKIGEAISEDALGPIGRGAGQPTPQEAQREIRQLQADPAYLNAQDPRHKDVIEEINRLTKLAYPSEAKVVAVDRSGFIG